MPDRRLTIVKDETGPARLNDFPITEEEHKRALKGEKVILKNSKSNEVILTLSGDRLTAEGKPILGDKMEFLGPKIIGYKLKKN